MVDKLLERYRYVVITGDHGTSRLAARFFHLRQGLTPPKDAVVMSHGRYCLLKSDAAVAYDSVKDVSDAAGNRYWVISSYDHFSIGGFAAGGDVTTRFTVKYMVARRQKKWLSGGCI